MASIDWDGFTDELDSSEEQKQRNRPVAAICHETLGGGPGHVSIPSPFVLPLLFFPSLPGVAPPFNPAL